MPLFIMKMGWTKKGISNIRDWSKRSSDARSYGKTVGVTVKEVYVVCGHHDMIAILEAPSADNVARFALGVGARGNVRTQTMQAWSEAEFAKFIGELPPPPK